MKLDTATIALSSVFIDIVLLLILIHTWRTRTTYPGFVTWIAGTACWVIGSTLNMLFNSMQPQFVPKIIGAGFILLHPMLLYEGIFLFHGIRKRRLGTILNGFVVVLSLINSFYFLYVEDSITSRTAGLMLALAFLFARISIEPLLNGACRRYSMQWLLSLSLLPLIGLLLARGWFSIAGLSQQTFQSMLLYDNLFRWTIFYSILVELILAYSYLSLTSDQVEYELKQAKEREKSIAEAQRHFFGMVTHEFKTPLSVVNRSAQMIVYNADKDDTPLIKRAETIRDSSVKLIELLDVCMNDAVLARGELDLALDDFDMNKLLEKVKSSCSSMYPERSIELVLPAAPSVCHGDERLLYHMAANLADNALKFSTQDVIIRLEQTPENFIITFSDSGVGVPSAEIEKLGERCYRATNAHSVPGSGIGFHSAQLIAGLHRGAISLNSLPDSGTVVTVLLPL